MACRPFFILAPRGFTMPELVAVIAIVAILAVFATSRLSGSFAATRGFFDQVYSQVSYARKAAVAQRRNVFVRIDATGSRLCYSAGGACTGVDAVSSPSGQSPFSVGPVPAGVTLTAAVFQFDAQGRYLDSVGGTPAVALPISVSGEGAYQFSVEPVTGYVHSP